MTERDTHLAVKAGVVLVNMRGKDLDRMADLVELWDYAALRIDEEKTSLALLAEAMPIIVIFKFREFSETEYGMLASLRNAAPGIPILALSAFISVKDTFRIAKSGASECLVQPYSPEDLKRMIEKHLDINPARPADSGEAHKVKSGEW